MPSKELIVLARSSMNVVLDNLGATVGQQIFLHFSNVMNGEVIKHVPYYMTFSGHIFLAILRFAYFAPVKFRDLFFWQ